MLESGPASVKGVLGSESTMVFLEDALASNFTVNQTVVDIMKKADTDGKMEKIDAAEGTTPCQEVAALSCAGANTYLYEFPSDIYVPAADSCTQTTGLVFIGRDAGEGGDLKTDGYADGTPHELALSQNEKDTIQFAKENCKNVVAIINSCNVIQISELMSGKYEVDAILWVGFLGTVGFQSMADILCGKVNPSGRTVDTWPADLTKNPACQNLGNFRYNNARITDVTDDAGGTAQIDAPFVEYEEGVYVGYKYYETADECDPSFDYEEEVVFPFGYGLSYTTFEQEIVDFNDSGDSIEIKIKVTNTGNIDGKEVVQVYYTAPYTEWDMQYDIEKPVKNLVTFAKTEVAAGESEIVELSFAKEDMASYCYTRENGDGTTGCYVLEGGNYTITLGKNSHDAWDSRTVSIEEEWFDNSNPRQSEIDGQSSLDDQGQPTGIPSKASVNTEAEFVAATNQFEESNDYMTSSKVTRLTRKDWTGSFPTRPDETTLTADESVVEMLEKYDYGTYDYENDPYLGNTEGSKVYTDVAPIEGADNGLSLIDLRGKDYYDEDWELLLDQIDYSNLDQLRPLLFNAAQTINPLDSIGLYKTSGVEGPSGIGMFSKMVPEWNAETMAYCSGMVISSTWNTELAYEVGSSIGIEAMNTQIVEGSHISGWTGPAMNLHRTPFGGRNGEYYSEDGLLSGMIGVQVINGAGDKGLYTIYKHFVLNDSETNRHGVCTWADEQTMRETYFKTFEIVFKNSRRTINYISDDQGTVETKIMRGAQAVMTSMNKIGTMPAGADYRLLTEVLRNEWGFQGFVQTDQPTQCDQDLMLRAGGDVQMSNTSAGGKDLSSATAKNCIRRAIHNIAYAVVNSNAMQNVAPGTIVYYDMSPWKIVLIAADIVVGIFVIVSIVWMILRGRDEKKYPERYR